MKLKEVIENVNISENDDQWIDFDTIGEDLGFNYIDLENIDTLKNNLLRSTYITGHLCTDSMVGFEAFFLGEDFVCLTHQSARKSSKEVIGWGSEELAEKTKAYIKSLIPEQMKEMDIEIIDMTQEMGDGFFVGSAEQLIHSQFLYNGHMVDLVKRVRHNEDGSRNSEDIIINDQGTEKTISVKDITIPFLRN